MTVFRSTARSASLTTPFLGNTSAHTGISLPSPTPMRSLLLLIQLHRMIPLMAPRQPASRAAEVPRALEVDSARFRRPNPLPHLPLHRLILSKQTWQLKFLTIASVTISIPNICVLFSSRSKYPITHRYLRIMLHVPNATLKCPVSIKSLRRSPEQQSKCRLVNLIKASSSTSRGALEKANAIKLPTP